VTAVLAGLILLPFGISKVKRWKRTQRISVSSSPHSQVALGSGNEFHQHIHHHGTTALVNGTEGTKDKPSQKEMPKATKTLLDRLENLNTVKLVDRGSGEEYTRSRELQDSDPRIYIDVLDKRLQVYATTPLELYNRGGSTAHEIQITPLVLTVGRVDFPEVDFIDKDTKKEVIPTIPGAGIHMHNIMNFLRNEANHTDRGTQKTFAVPMSATYRDYAGKKRFRVTFDIVHNLYNEAMYRDRTELQNIKGPFCEIKNTVHTVIRN
jgi:hypothetical protein